MQISQKELIEALGVSPSTIKNWVKEGMPKAGRGLFDLGPTIKWIRENKPLATAPGSLTAARERKVSAEAKLKELDVMIREGQLIPRDSVLQEFLKRIFMVRSGLLSLPRTLPPRLEGKPGRDQGVIIKKAVYALLNKFSDKRGVLKK